MTTARQRNNGTPSIGAGRAIPGWSIRLLIPTGAGMVAAAADRPPVVALALLVATTIVTTLLPGRLGAAPTLTAAVFTVVPHLQTHNTTAIAAAATGLFLIHSATGLAAACPLRSKIALDVLRRWTARSIPALAVSSLAITIATTVDPTSNPTVAAIALTVVATAVLLFSVRTLTERH